MHIMVTVYLFNAGVVCDKKYVIRDPLYWVEYIV